MSASARTRSLFKADAAFEAILGAVLVAGASSSVLTSSDIPLGQAVLIGGGASLLLASASQLVYFINRPRRVLFELAMGNAGMAAAGVIWLSVDPGFSVTGATLVSLAIAWKMAIGLLQKHSLKPTAVQ